LISPISPNPLIRYLAPDGTLGAGVWSTPAVDEAAHLCHHRQRPVRHSGCCRRYLGTHAAHPGCYYPGYQGALPSSVQPGNQDIDWDSSPVSFRTRDGQQFIAANGKDGGIYVLRQPDLSLAWWFKLGIRLRSPSGTMRLAFHSLVLVSSAIVSPSFQTAVR
jgi:hypothetical protein